MAVDLDYCLFVPITLGEQRIHQVCWPRYPGWMAITDLVWNGHNFSRSEYVPVLSVASTAEEQGHGLFSIAGKEVCLQRGVLQFRHAQ
jgi:hypothetical protein